MAWRFKASKFKNAVGAPARRTEWLLDIDVGELKTASNPTIAASGAYIAFSQEGRGSGCVGVVDPSFSVERDPSSGLDPVQPPVNVELFQPHGSQPVTCLEFSPFDDGLLATGSEDSMVKLWHLKDDRETPECLFIPSPDARVEVLRFHPTCDFLLSSAAGDRIQLFDLVAQKQVIDFLGEFSGPVSSMDWRHDGVELAAVDQQSSLVVVDPRKTNSAVSGQTSLAPNKEAYVVWLGEGNAGNVLVTGFDKSRQRIACVYDVRTLKSPAGSLDFGTGIGSLVPLYDADSGMVFLSARGEAAISFAEIVSSVPNVRSKAMSQFGTKAACLAPKRSLGVMNGEVNRVYQLSSRNLVPMRFKVPRKSYRDFHADIFPLTRGVESAIVPELWLRGRNIPVPKISLDPAVIKNDEMKCIRKSLSARKQEAEEKKTICLKTESELSNVSANKNAKPAPPTTDKPIVGSKSESVVIDANANTEGVTLRSKISPLKRNDEVRRSARELRDQFESRLAGSTQNSEPLSDKPVRKTFPLRNQSVEETRAEVFKKPSGEPIRGNDDAGENSNSTSETAVMRKKNELSASDAKGNSQGDGNDNHGEFQRQASNRKSKTFGRVAKFRHMKGNVPPRAQQYENLRDLNPSLPTECDAIKGNEERFAITLRGPGGKVLVWDLANTGRLPDTIALLALINTASVTDFAWDPFNANRLAVATDDGTINIWDVAAVEADAGDGDGARNQPQDHLRRPHGVPEKITVIKWHPSAENILAVAHADGSIDVWDASVPGGQIAFQFADAGAGTGVWSMEWSPDGRKLAILARDGKMRVLDGRTGDVLDEGDGFSKGRGARVVWVLGGTMLLTSGFEAGSSRVVKLFDAMDLKKGSLKTLEMDVSPSLIVPLYDEDSSTLFLYAKGDTTIHTHEVLSESPYLYPLSPHRSATPHHGLTLLPKRIVDVKAVEFARALRLTDSVIEPIFFCVPRVKSEYFQDDLFPPTQQTWIPTVDAGEWIEGVDKEQPFVSLKPEGMFALNGSSVAGGDSGQNKAYKRQVSAGSKEESAPLSDKEKQKTVETSLSSLVTVNMKLEQDEMDGVDPQEWE